MKFTQIPADTFEKLQLNAGVLVDDFDPDTLVLGNILGATSGGVSFSDVPEYQDWGEDIDNCPKNTMELKHITDHTITLSGTFITVDAATAAKLMGAADVTDTHIIPREDLADSDFDDIWWVGDYSDVNTGENAGYIAIHVMNALNTSGFAIQSTDKAKGQFAFEFTGHYSIDDPSEVPYEIYVKDGSESNPPQLTALTIGSLVLSPTFSTATTTYTASTTNATNTVTATVSNGGTAVIKVNGTTIQNGGTATWETGTNTVTVTVGSTVYTVTVTKS